MKDKHTVSYILLTFRNVHSCITKYVENKKNENDDGHEPLKFESALPKRRGDRFDGIILVNVALGDD